MQKWRKNTPEGGKAINVKVKREAAAWFVTETNQGARLGLPGHWFTGFPPVCSLCSSF